VAVSNIWYTSTNVLLGCGSV